MDHEPHRILLVEDDPADIFLAQEIFQEHGGFALSVVDNGKHALAFLRGDEPYQDEARPELVLLDLNIPGIDGREVLKAIKQDDDLCVVPVLIMSTSDAPDDVVTSYRLGANCFITKPVGLDGFEALIDSLESFWFRFAQLPPN